MGKLRALPLFLLAACGSDHGSTPDAQIIVTKDAAIDAKIFMDAPPPSYDFSCFGMDPGTTVADMVTVSGAATAISVSGQMAVADADVSVYKVGDNTAAASTTTGANGAFTLTDVATGGTALEHLVASKPTLRTTYLYPSDPVRANISGVPLVMISASTFGTIAGVIDVEQDDAVNGALVIAVMDCDLANPTSINGATLTVQQGGQDVGDVFDLGALASQFAGTFFVFNVPDGPTQVSASYDNMTFPTHTVVAHKQPDVKGADGTITATNVLPGPVF